MALQTRHSLPASYAMKLLFLTTLFCGSSHCWAGEKKFELSFGTSQMLVDDVERADIKDRHKVVLPTTGAVLIAEYLWNEKWGSLCAFNMPLETQKFMVNNVLVQETAAKSILLGQRYTPIQWHVTDATTISPQVSVLLSTMFGTSTQVSPSLAGRLHITDESGFTMYAGAITTYGIKGYVLFYGIGHQFQ